MPLPLLVPTDILPLQDREIREKFEELVFNVTYFDDLSEALQTYRYLQWLLRQPGAAPRDTDILARYTQLFPALQLTALPGLSDQEVEEFFRIHAAVGLTNPDINLWDKVEAKLVRIPVFEARDPFRTRLRAALEANEEVLTDAVIRSADKTLPGIVGNWLADYRKEAGTGRISTLVRSAYLINSINTRSLSATDREKVKKLIELYEKLKLSSMEDDGIEENYVFERDGRLFTLRGGRLEEEHDEKAETLVRHLKQKGFFDHSDLSAVERWRMAKAEQHTKITKAQRDFKAVYEGVEEELQRLRQVKISHADLQERLYNAVFPGPGHNTERIVALASLLLLAERGELGAALDGPNRLRKSFEEWLAGNKATLLNGFRVQSSAPQYVALFLQMILEQKLGIRSSDAAAIGARLGNLMKAAGKSEYFGMAYFDEKQNIFVWQ